MYTVRVGDHSAKSTVLIHPASITMCILGNKDRNHCRYEHPDCFLVFAAGNDGEKG